MLININIRATFTIPDTGETFIIDSSYARNNGDIVPYIAVAGRSVAGVMPIINLTLANLPPDILTKVSLLNLKTKVRIDAGYNNDYKFIAEGSVIRFPEIQSNETEWLWTVDVVPLESFLDDIDYTPNFEKYRTWQYVMDRYFGSSNLTIVIPEDLANQTIGAPFGLNISTFVDLQDYFKAREKFLDYRDGIITFDDGKSNISISAEITPQQIKPNQYLDFQSGRDATLELAGWVPNIRSGVFVNLTDKNGVVSITDKTIKGFNGTMGVLKSLIHLTTTEHPVHSIVLRPLTENE